jgi:hypothetical protein
MSLSATSLAAQAELSLANPIKLLMCIPTVNSCCRRPAGSTCYVGAMAVPDAVGLGYQEDPSYHVSASYSYWMKRREAAGACCLVAHLTLQLAAILNASATLKPKIWTRLSALFASRATTPTSHVDAIRAQVGPMPACKHTCINIRPYKSCRRPLVAAPWLRHSMSQAKIAALN